MARRDVMADKTSEVPADHHEIESRPMLVLDVGDGGRRREEYFLVVRIDHS
jgi:hypothetical protein